MLIIFLNREYHDIINECINNASSLVDIPATIEPEIEIVEEEELIAPTPMKEDMASVKENNKMTQVMLKENRLASPSDNKEEEMNVWKPRLVKEPFGISQRLNVSG